MVVETLCALGRPDAVIPWIEGYKRRFQDRPRSQNPIAHGDWRAFLSDASCLADWVTFFDRTLAEAPWHTVPREWLPRLAPGLRLRQCACKGAVKFLCSE